MWLVTKKGFFSVVEHRDDVNTVLVRARDRKDLEWLCEIADDVRRQDGREAIGFEDERILMDESADYLWRLIVPRIAWCEVAMRLMIAEIDYPNFKSAVEDKQRASLYMRVWSTLLSIQPVKRWQRGGMTLDLAYGEGKAADEDAEIGEFDEQEWRDWADEKGIDLDTATMGNEDTEEQVEKAWREHGGYDM
jgi:hypothetical protein